MHDTPGGGHSGMSSDEDPPIDGEGHSPHDDEPGSAASQEDNQDLDDHDEATEPPGSSLLAAYREGDSWASAPPIGDAASQASSAQGPSEEPAEGSTASSRAELRAADKARRKRRRWRIALITGSSIVGFALLVAAAGAGYLWYENNRIHRVHIKHLAQVKTSGSQKDVENILLIGSTTRCGLKQQNQAFGYCDEGVTGVNSDVVMILHLDPDHHKASILSIPRDTIVPNAREDGLNKIDAALGDPDGPSQLIAAVSEDFGIPIQHYVELNFDTFQAVVSALGGLKMYFPLPVYDLHSSLYIPTPGCVALSPFQALAVVRSRDLQYQPSDEPRLPRYDWTYDPQSDLSRIRRDHEFLRVLATAVAKRGLGNIVNDIQLINSLAGNLETDQNFSATDMANLVLEFHSVDPNSVPEYTLPVVVDSGGQYYYRGGGYGDVVFPYEPADSQVIAQFLGTAPNEDSAGVVLPAAGSVSVDIENGSGIYNEGSKTGSALESLGYNVPYITNTEVGASTTETTVLYSDPSKLDDALAVQSSLSGLSVLGYDPGLFRTSSYSSSTTSSTSTTSTSGSGSSSSTSTGSSTSQSKPIDVGSTLAASDQADVVVVVGSNFSVSVPPGSTSTSTSTSAPSSSTTTSTTLPGSSGSSTTTTTTTTIPDTLVSNPNLSAPSSSVTSLEPWDPRSCTPSGGPGP